MWGVRLAVFLLLALALCTVPFGESGCVFVDSEKTGQITFEAWRSECQNWTTQEDFLDCTREDVDVTSQSGSVTLAPNGNSRPVEPTAEVGDGYGSDWADGAWTHCAPVTITNPCGPLTDYQVRVNVSYRDEMQDDFSDIRFTNDTGHLLPHWRDEHAGSAPAVFWVRVPSIPPGDSTIDLRYGNESAGSASNGTATFLFYDDFENTTDLWDRWVKEGNIEVWEEKQSGNRVLGVRNRILESGIGYMVAKDSEWSDIAVRERYRLGILGGAGGVTARYGDMDNYLSAPVIYIFASIAGCFGGTSWSCGEDWMISGGWSIWHTEEFGLSGQRGDLYVDGSYLGSAILPPDAPSSGTTGFYVNDIGLQYRDEHIVRRYSPVYQGDHYLSNGTLLSDIFDTGADGSKWDSLAWDAELPAGTAITWAVRASDTPFEPDDAAPLWTPVETPSPVSAALPSGRYLQWCADLSTTEDTVTPVLQEVRVWYTSEGD